MTTNTTTTRSAMRDPCAAADPLLWREMSFTAAGFQALRVYRQKLSIALGRDVRLGVALDHLIKSHPFTMGRPECTGGAQ